MTYLVDTDIVASWLKGRQEEISLLKRLGPSGLAISLITYGEIYDGIYYGRDPQEHEAVFGQFLQAVTVVPLTESIMQHFARIRGHLRRTGNIIGDTDILIAATAIHHSLILVTRNLRHFRRVPALTLYQADSPD